jgi:hypothetical protein
MDKSTHATTTKHSLATESTVNLMETSSKLAPTDVEDEIVDAMELILSTPSARHIITRRLRNHRKCQYSGSEKSKTSITNAIDEDIHDDEALVELEQVLVQAEEQEKELHCAGIAKTTVAITTMLLLQKIY